MINILVMSHAEFAEGIYKSVGNDGIIDITEAFSAE